jgi:hypothetical protein
MTRWPTNRPSPPPRVRFGAHSRLSTCGPRTAAALCPSPGGRRRGVRWCGPAPAPQRSERPAKSVGFGKQLIESVLYLLAKLVDHWRSMGSVTPASRGSYGNDPTDKRICSLRPRNSPLAIPKPQRRAQSQTQTTAKVAKATERCKGKREDQNRSPQPTTPGHSRLGDCSSRHQLL